MKNGIDLSNGAAERFERWFESVAKPAVALEVVFEEVMAVVESGAGRRSVLFYELRPHHTLSHRSEFFRIEPGDLVGTWIDRGSATEATDAAGSAATERGPAAHH